MGQLIKNLTAVVGQATNKGGGERKYLLVRRPTRADNHDERGKEILVGQATNKGGQLIKGEN